MTDSSDVKKELPPSVSEGWIIFLIASVQFIFIIDFVMLMPLGPDIGLALDIPLADWGWIAGSYTLAAAAVGVISAAYLDLFDRKQALLCSFAGLCFLTAINGLAWSFASMITFRVLTGIFAGPCTALCFAVIADIVPNERRGRAMSKLMLAFTVASVIGIPFALELARIYTWNMPFFVTAGLGSVVWVAVWHYLPSLRGHLKEADRSHSFKRLWHLFSPKLHLQAFVVIALGMMAAFLLIPNLATYVQFNMGLPRDQLGFLYMVGGIVSFFVAMTAGRAVDATTPSFIGALGASVLILVMVGGFIMEQPILTPILIYSLFMLGMSLRNISTNTLASKIPAPSERAGFMALISCTSQSSSALGAFLASYLLHSGPNKELLGMDKVAWIGVALSLCVPVMMLVVERQMRKRDLEKECPPVAVELQ